MTERKPGPEEDFFDLGDELGELDAGPGAPESPAEGARTQQTGSGPHKPNATPSRPLYRPPSPGAVAPPSRSAKPFEPARKGGSFDDDDDEEGATRIGKIPEELLRSLNEPGPGKATARSIPAVRDDEARAAALPRPPFPAPNPPGARGVKAPYVPPPPPPTVRQPRPVGAPGAPPLPPKPLPKPPAPAVATPSAPAVAKPPAPDASASERSDDLLDPWAVDNETVVGGGLDVSWSRLDDLGAVPVKRMVADELDDDLDILLGAPSSAPAPAAVPRSDPDADPDADADADADADPDADADADADPDPDPDEPEVSMGDDDVELEIGDDDDVDVPAFGEPKMPRESVVGLGDDLDSLHDGETPADGMPIAAPPRVSAPGDRGAEAAKRTVRQRKPRTEVLPLVGRHPEAQKARVELLVALAERASGAQRARLLVSAAELCERAGDPRATELLGEAHAADPGDVHLLRTLRRGALERGDCQEAARLLSLEVERAGGDDERALALCLLAELELHQLGRTESAEAHAARALDLRPRSVVAALLVAEAAARRKAFEAVGDALASAGDAVAEGPLRAAFLVEAARLAERAGAAEAARSRSERAAEADPRSLGAILGVARCRLRDGDGRDAAALLGRARALLEGEHEGLDRVRSRLLTLREGAHEEAAQVVEGARTALGLLARADAARATGDGPGAATAYGAAASALGGRDRAVALLSAAELSAEVGAFAEADRALREAGHADPGLALVQAIREKLADLAGDPAVLPISTRDGAAHAERVAAAVRALANGRLDEERSAIDGLAEAAPLVHETLGLDAAAGAGDSARVARALREKADRQAPSARVGSLIALASLLSARGDAHEADAVFREARELSPGDPLILRPLAENASRTAPLEAAALRLEESAASTGDAAAFAATWAARLLERAGGDPSPAYRRALHAAPGYLPAVVGLLPIVEQGHADAEARDLHRAAAKRIEDPHRAALHLASAVDLSVREPGMLAELIRDVARLRPDDPALVELALELEGWLEPALRASLLEAGLASTAGSLRKAIRLAAARAQESAGAFEAAADLYRAAFAEDGDVAARRGVERAELAANQLERLAESQIRSVRAATSDIERRRALEALAELDLHHRADPMKALLSLESVLEIAPGDLAILRTLERIYMDGGVSEEVARIEDMLLDRLEGADAAGAARFRAALLLPTDLGGSELDGMWVRAARRGVTDVGALRRIGGAAARSRDSGVLYETLATLARGGADAASRLWYALRAAAEADRVGKLEEAIERLRAAIEQCPDHPTANEELARLHARAGNHREAAERLEAAAEGAEGAGRRARLWFAASSMWLDQVGDVERGLLALEATTRADITYLDAYDRARELLVARGDLPRALRLTEARIGAGGDAAQRAQLEAIRADLCERLGDAETASAALRAAIELAPDDLRTLRRLAELYLRTENHASAADALIRIARKEQDREELRWVFMTLGDIYDRHLPDAKRADIAFRRVLKLSPGDEEALDRLARLHLRSGDLAQVEAALGELFAAHPSSAKARERCIEFAAALESRGEDRRAEEALDHARRAAPTDIAVLRALSEFYRRQNAVSALSVHLARAAADHRRAVDEHPEQASGWSGLAQVLSWSGQEDASRCAAMAAIALGVRDVTLARLVDASGNVPGAHGAAVGPEIEELLAPRLVPTVVRQGVRFAGPVLHKVLPFDAKAFRAERLRGHPLVEEAERIARGLRIPDVHVLVTDLAPRICVPVSDEPAIIVVGRELSSVTTEDERAFLFARALQIARAGLSIAMRAQPDQMTLLMTALAATFDPMVRRDGVEPALLDDASKRIAKVMPRRLRNELEPIFLEIAGRADIDTSKLGLAVADFGNRLGLLTTGALGSAVSALVRLAGHELGEPDPEKRAAVMRRMPETWALLHFAISDAHFEARRRAFSERRS